MSKSTHKGHCQACGRLQMLPSGVLAKHGYTVSYGYFSGVCAGSGHLPFEKSCALVVEFIESAKRALGRVEAFMADLRKPATEAKCWVRNYEAKAADPLSVRLSHAQGNTYRWREVSLIVKEFVIREGEPSEYRYSKVGYIAPSVAKSGWDSTFIADSFHDIDHVNDRTNLLLIAGQKNSEYAAWTEHEADSLRRYISWQTYRVETWKEEELVPVSTKTDKAGFVPTAPKY